MEERSTSKDLKWIPHVFFWLSIWLLFTFLESNATNFFTVLAKESINVVFYILLIYINLYILIPKFLTDKKFVTYVISLLGLVIVVTSAKIVIFYFILFDNPVAKNQLVQNQEWLFILNFILVGSSTIFGIIKEWVTHQRIRKELEKQNMQSELNFLKSQVNPHFLFNTLNSLYALTLKKSDKAPDTVLRLSEIMRYMLYECNERYVPLEKEISYVQNYLDLEKLRHGEGVDIQFNIMGDVQDKNIAPLILIPFVENAFKHGIKNQIKDGFVHLELRIEGDSLYFKVQNSKPVITIAPSQNEKRSGGIGLVNVQRRLNLLYPDKYKLKINNSKLAYNIQLKLLLN